MRIFDWLLGKSKDHSTVLLSVDVEMLLYENKWDELIELQRRGEPIVRKIIELLDDKKDSVREAALEGGGQLYMGWVLLNN